VKIKLTSDWLDYGHLHTCGTIVDVSDNDGAILIAAGHIEVHPDTRSTRNNVYTVGCVPTPFNTQLSATYAGIAYDIAMSEPANEGTLSDKKKRPQSLDT
jgi:hypothetical protein